MYQKSYKRNPLTLNYMKILRICLWSITVWPGEVFGEKLTFSFRCLRKYFIFHQSVATLGIAYYVYKYNEEINFILLGQCLLNFFMSFVASIRIILSSFKAYQRLMKEFFLSFHLIHFQNLGAYSDKTDKLVNRVSYYYTILMLVAMVIGEIMFNVCPWYHNYKIGMLTGNRIENSTIDFAVHFTYPGIEPADWFWCITLYNLFSTHVCSLLFVGIDLLLYLMIFQIIGHIQILRNSFQAIARPKKRIISEDDDSAIGENIGSVEKYDTEENINIHKKLTEWVDHHRIIVNFTQETSNFFGPMLGVNYLFHLFSCCLLLLECTTGDLASFSRFGPLTIVIFSQLIMISCVFEIVNTVSEKIKDDVYDIPWECMDVRNQRTVYIILNRVQTPITVTAMGMVPVGVTTMTAILKTTFSYFAFLKSIEN